MRPPLDLVAPARVALGGLLDVEDAGPLAFLVSDEAATMTGQTLAPDAGLVLL